MIEKIKKVYYCEHCKKKRLFVKSAMERHEKRCTMNLDRICSFCGEGNIRPLIDKYKGLRIANCFNVYSDDNNLTGSFVTKDDEIKKLIDDIRNEVEFCPACALTIIRNIFVDKMWATRSDFNYEQEKTEWWKNNKEDDNLVGFEGE